jgi:uncharacterized BrkB/YihY/UPF0761 family membrane protein
LVLVVLHLQVQVKVQDLAGTTPCSMELLLQVVVAAPVAIRTEHFSLIMVYLVVPAVEQQLKPVLLGVTAWLVLR